MERMRLKMKCDNRDCGSNVAGWCQIEAEGDERPSFCSPPSACSAPLHHDVMKAAKALVGVAWVKDKDRIPGAVDRLLDELKKHPAHAEHQRRL